MIQVTAQQNSGNSIIVSQDSSRNSPATLFQGIDYITNGLKAWYKFDEGSGATIIDSTGNGHDGTSFNSPAYVTGKVGPYALSYNGTNNYSSITNASDFQINVGESFTITGWAKFTSIATFNMIFSKGNTSGPGAFEYAVLAQTSTFGILLSTNGLTWGKQIFSDTVTTGQWYFFAAGFDYTNQITFFQMNNGTTSTVSTTNVFLGTNDINIARNRDPIQFSPPIVDDIRFYKRVLTPTELTLIYNIQG